MDIVDLVEAVGNTRDDQAAWNQAQGIEFLRAVLHGDISAVEIRADLYRERRFGTRLLGYSFIQQPTENQSYKQPFGQTKRFFLKCGNRPFIVSY